LTRRLAPLLVLLLAVPALAQPELVPRALRASASLAADATVNVGPGAYGDRTFPAAMLRIRVASASGFSAQVKVQAPEVLAGGGARVLCTLATLTANGDYLFAIGSGASADVSGSCAGVPASWQLFLDHSAGSADVAVEIYPLVQATAAARDSLRFWTEDQSAATLITTTCLLFAEGDFTTGAAQVCGFQDTTATFAPGTPARVDRITCVGTGTSITGALQLDVRWRKGDAPGTQTDSAAFLSIPAASFNGSLVSAPIGSACPYAGSGCMLSVHVRQALSGGTGIDLSCDAAVTG
jgi:hypothetical protein